MVGQTDEMEIGEGISGLAGPVLGMGLHVVKWVGLPVQRKPRKARHKAWSRVRSVRGIHSSKNMLWNAVECCGDAEQMR